MQLRLNKKKIKKKMNKTKKYQKDIKNKGFFNKKKRFSKTV